MPNCYKPRTRIWGFGLIVSGASCSASDGSTQRKENEKKKKCLAFWVLLA